MHSDLRYIEDLPEKDYISKGSVRKIIDEFLESGESLAEVYLDLNRYANSYSQASSYRKALRAHPTPVIITTRNGKNYLIRTDSEFYKKLINGGKNR